MPSATPASASHIDEPLFQSQHAPVYTPNANLTTSISQLHVQTELVRPTQMFTSSPTNF